MYPPPSHYGLPDQFSTWREGQFEAIQNSLASPARVCAQAAPTGFGKSHILMGEAMMSGGRSLILTSTKPLMDQYYESYNSCFTELRGQQNYLCLALSPGGEHYAPYVPNGATVDEGPCHFGEGCSLLLGGCTYYDRVRLARLDTAVLTNYDLILSMNRYAEGLGHFDNLFCDEAHEVPEKLSSSMGAEVTEWEARTLLRDGLHTSEDPRYWANWATTAKARVVRTIEGIRQSGDTAESRHKLKSLSRIKRTLDQMSQAGDGWVTEITKDKVRVEPVWAKQFVEPYLFTGAKKVVFSSATIRPKTLSLLGIEDFDFFEYPSPFPIDRRPVWYVPTVKMRWDTPWEKKLRMVQAVDQIIARRLDRKIIIPTTSYALQKLLLDNSRFREYMVFNSKGERGSDIAQVIETFKSRPAPCILVSPSISTGVDFPGVECETVIIIKVPFPDTSSKIFKARTSEDPEYGPYVAAQTLVQMAGRGMRSKEDRCETIILDSSFSYMRGYYSHLFPSWFLTAVRKSDTLPSPSQKL